MLPGVQLFHRSGSHILFSRILFYLAFVGYLLFGRSSLTHSQIHKDRVGVGATNSNASTPHCMYYCNPVVLPYHCTVHGSLPRLCTLTPSARAGCPIRLVRNNRGLSSRWRTTYNITEPRSTAGDTIETKQQLWPPSYTAPSTFSQVLRSEPCVDNLGFAGKRVRSSQSLSPIVRSGVVAFCS